jgi:glutamate-5-semialdehyde dehydrogenase
MEPSASAKNAPAGAGTDPADLRAEIRALASAAKDAAQVLAAASTATKRAVLERAAALLEGELAEGIVAANARDLARAKENDLAPAMLDRLALDRDRLTKVAAGVRQVASLPDPVGAVDGLRTLDSGLKVGRMRIPLGVIGIIYESRPNVTADAAALCVMSGNAVILRGGSEAFESNRAIAEAFTRALEETGLPAACVTPIPTTDRAATGVLIEQADLVDLIIPRGGEGLIRFVTDHSRVPVIQHFKGVCHVYVDGQADLERALAIAVNAKAQRPGVCNAMETLLVDAACAEAFLPTLGPAMAEAGVTLRAGERARKLLPGAEAASESDWDEEYLALVLAVKVVDGFEGALAHVRAHGSHHTESIITESYTKAQRWLREVDASLVLVNASTRFNDGFELGLGAEMGISTTKMHAYGPMGLEELCARKWIAYGDGQTRQ